MTPTRSAFDSSITSPESAIASSAAATAMTKKAMAWPFIEPCWRAKARKVRLAALSMSSMHIRTTMAFLRVSTP